MKKPFLIHKFTSPLVVMLVAMALTACGGSSSSTEPTREPINTNNPSQPKTLTWSAPVIATMDASASTQIGVFDLSSGTSATVGSMDEYTANWHFSYQKFRFFHTNSGSSGSGNHGTEIESCRAYEYPNLYDDGNPVQTEFEKLNASNTLAQFEALDVDACTEYTKDTAITPQYIGNDWYETAGQSLSIPAGTAGWIIKSANDTYARITPKEYNNGLIFTVENWNGASWNAALDTPAIDYYMQSNAYYDLDTNTAGTADTQGWDIHVKNTHHYPEIILADGVTMGFYFDADANDAFTYESVAQIDNPSNPQAGITLYKWFGNETDGAMRKPGDLGGLEMIEFNYFPTYTTYMLKEGDTYYKVQILGYKGEDGTQTSGNLVIRYSVGRAS